MRALDAYRAQRIATDWTRDRVNIGIIAIWPFLFLWPYTLHQLSIGNDFNYAQYNYKAYLLVALSSWHFPLWSPTELAGFPFFSNPFAQAVYPLNLLYVAFYAVTGRFYVWHYTLFTIMGISIFGIGLYYWLRRMVFPGYVALLATMIACMSLKVTEIIRFPNAIHSAAWLPWLLLGITMTAARKDVVRGAMTFGIATLMLLTAGYPYYVVYAPFLIAPYFIAMLFAPARTAFLGLPPNEQTGSVRHFVSIGVAFAIAAAIALPWLLHVMALLDQTRDRATPDFAFATQHKFDFVSTIGSWIYPPAASMEGWYYFGMPAALLIATYFCCLPIRSFGFERHRGIALWIFAWFAVVTYFTWGADSVLFRFVWHHVPVLNQMRVWPRLNIVLVPAIACLFALAFSFFVSVVRTARAGWTRQTTIFTVVCATLALLAVAIQIFMIRNDITNSYWYEWYACPSCQWAGREWPQSLLAYRLDERFFPVMTVLAAAGLLVAVLLAQLWRSSHLPTALAALICTLSISDLFYISNTQWPHPPIDIGVQKNAFADLVSLAEPRTLDPALADPFTRHHSVGLVDSWGFIRHEHFFLQSFAADGTARLGISQDQIAAARRFFGVDRSAKRLFLTSRIDYASPVDFMRDVDATAASGVATVEIAFFDGDTLRLGVDSQRAAWLSYIDNWDPNWTATVNGRGAMIERLFGSYKSIRVPTGRSTVVFSYRPGLLPSAVK